MLQDKLLQFEVYRKKIERNFEKELSINANERIALEVYRG